MRRWRGSNGPASLKGEEAVKGLGRSGVEEMVLDARRWGRRRAASVVWRGGDGGGFYRVTLVS
jgi:hypothetical protein